MISQKIKIKNFQYKKKNKNILRILSSLLKDQSQLILSLGSKYKNNKERYSRVWRNRHWL